MAEQADTMIVQSPGKNARGWSGLAILYINITISYEYQQIITEL